MDGTIRKISRIDSDVPTENLVYNFMHICLYRKKMCKNEEFPVWSQKSYSEFEVKLEFVSSLKRMLSPDFSFWSSYMHLLCGPHFILVTTTIIIKQAVEQLNQR